MTFGPAPPREASAMRGVPRARSEGEVQLGYAISSEEHSPLDLVANAARAEEAGFGFALVYDHVHPWIDLQG